MFYFYLTNMCSNHLHDILVCCFLAPWEVFDNIKEARVNIHKIKLLFPPGGDRHSGPEGWRAGVGKEPDLPERAPNCGGQLHVCRLQRPGLCHERGGGAGGAL